MIGRVRGGRCEKGSARLTSLPAAAAGSAHAPPTPDSAGGGQGQAGETSILDSSTHKSKLILRAVDVVIIFLNGLFASHLRKKTLGELFDVKVDLYVISVLFSISFVPDTHCIFHFSYSVKGAVQK